MEVVQGRKVIVIGGSLAGLFAAAASASAGADTTIIERDVLPTEPSPRRGVPQSRQPHVLLHRGLLAAQELLPGLREDLIRHGAAHFDSGAMPWLSEYGWLPTWIPSFELVSATRPLLEHVVRQRVRELPNVVIHEGVRVSQLRRSAGKWQAECEDATMSEADIVIDASGRSSRLSHWLSGLGYPVQEPHTIDAHFGYACRVYRANGSVPLSTGLMIVASPASDTGALAIPVEDDKWLVVSAGYGDRRPSRETDEFLPFLDGLRDRAIADLVRRLEPISDVAIYRQTANRRNTFGRSRAWPANLIVVGDAYCAFNPIYGQGITVAACQALLVRDALAKRRALRTVRLQRRIAAVADLPWSVATSEELRRPTTAGKQSRSQQLMSRWSAELAQLMTRGDRGAYRAFTRVYHLMGGPIALFHPALFLSAGRAAIRGLPPPAPRPAILDSFAPEGSPTAASPEPGVREPRHQEP
jgi:2-polyprenyl-6-methoxyphenol hydroxylase-like FAD-dependent oxidoreductase